MDELDQLKQKFDESHKLIMRILEIAEYANVKELKKLNEILDDNDLQSTITKFNAYSKKPVESV